VRSSIINSPNQVLTLGLETWPKKPFASHQCPLRSFSPPPIASADWDAKKIDINMNPFLRPQYAQFLTTTIMLGVVFLWYYSIVLAEALQDQSRVCRRNFGLYAQSPLSEGCKITLTCEDISRSISSKSQVFYPGEIRVVGCGYRPLIRAFRFLRV
jgi:hypothetical protein